MSSKAVLMLGPAIQNEKPTARWLVFVETHKGDLTLLLSALIYAASWCVIELSTWRTAGQLLRAIGEASLVGGLCDYIALKMIFERRWYLPNSGVLPRNRQKLIDGIAATIETQWLTPEMIEAKLRQLKLVDRLGRYLEGVSIETLLAGNNLTRLCQSLAHQVESDQMLNFFEERLRAAAPRPLKLANSVGILTYREVSERIARELRKLILGLPHNEQLIGDIETRIHALGDELQQRNSAARETAERLMDTLVEYAVTSSRGQIAMMVKENLMKLSDDEIRLQIETRTRTHLDWIRVNGGLFGAIFGAMFGILNFVLHYGANWSAILR
jgi:uncharacterized membrane-anchored protein YjiN (DUF445 family)